MVSFHSVSRKVEILEGNLMGLRNYSKRNYIEFFVLSFISLFFELLIIRWMSSEIRAFSVFKTFPLIACFLGLGAGYALARKDLFKTTPWAILLFAALVKIIDFSHLSLCPFPSLSIYDWQAVVDSTSNIWHVLGVFLIALPFLVLAPFAVMLCIGARLGTLFNEFKPLNAYCINIAGALVGSLVFSLSSFWNLSPGTLLLAAGLVSIFYSSNDSRKEFILACVAILTAALLAGNPNPTYDKALTYWSPYQRIDFAPVFSELQNKHSIEIDRCLYANRVPYQAIINWQAINNNINLISADEIKKVRSLQRGFELPFNLQKPEDVLIIGAGTGNDVAEALKSTAKNIDAVEIDPVILKLGKQYHPAHPYDSSRVNIICNDARYFFNNCSKKYDLIILSYLDSHIVTAGSSLRIDNFVYTKESFASIAKLLKPNGLAVVSFCTVKPWFSERLYKTIQEAVGYEPLALSQYDMAGTAFVFGESVKNHSLKIPPHVLEKFELITSKPSKSTRLLTDDWPYLYVAPDLIDLPYLLVVFEISLIAIFIASRSLKNNARVYNWQMFFLGGAFMLLELQAISRLSVLYGTTWLTTAIVINVILLLILFANIIVIKFPKISVGISTLYVLLFLSLLFSYSIPFISVLIINSIGASPSAVFITAFTLLPVLLAGAIFAISFSKVQSPKDALAMNLFGAFLGSMLEYLSNYIGINGLTWLVAILYLGSFICWKRMSITDKI